MSTIMNNENSSFDVSVIIPIHNGQKWIEPCFNSILKQNAIGQLKIEVCICNDASTDQTPTLLQKWKDILEKESVQVSIFTNTTSAPKGVGFAKNRAVDISRGEYLCFQDVDDIMLPDRIKAQYDFIENLERNIILGSKFERIPIDSTVRYTSWANNLSDKQLNEQIYTSNGPTVIMPTWFLHRDIFYRLGGFCEKGVGVPEDLIFFYKHLDSGGKIHRVDEVLVLYSYNLTGATFSVKEDTIWDLRISRLQKHVIDKWEQFTIWNAGKQGRKFFNSLDPKNKNKVVALCDVDRNKIGKMYTPFDTASRTAGPSIPIVKFTDAKPPFVICVKMGMTNGVFEENLQSLNLVENIDYIIFS